MYDFPSTDLVITGYNIILNYTFVHITCSNVLIF